MILDSVAVDVLKEWATVNRGAFVLARCAPACMCMCACVCACVLVCTDVIFGCPTSLIRCSMVQSKVPQVSSRTAEALAGMLTWLKAVEGKGQLALAKDIERALSSQTAH